MFKYIIAILIVCCHTGILFAQQVKLPNGTGSPESIGLDHGWRLWLDERAEWKNDKLYLPDEVDLAKLPANPPTGGWKVLSGQAGIPVTLPGTVEEYYWGKRPLPTANPSRPEDVVNLCSPYVGVSWWYRNFIPPVLKSGEKLILSFPGARLRAEIYVNQKLVGYNLISEVPFTADVTDALMPGQSNQLAVRITNPGGTFTWGDFELYKWGDYQYPVSHGFGGIDGGVTMSVHAAVAVEDLYVANNPDPRTVTLNATVASTGRAYKGPLLFTISRDGKKVWSGKMDVTVSAGGETVASKQVTVPDAELWDIAQPVLYQAGVGIKSIPHSGRVTDFGFRWFNAEGIGTNPRLVLNGRRIFVSSAISWGYWAPNGLFPDQAAVQREVDAVRALGMNCVQNHRHFPKAAVLDGFDQAGLLRYCEPGGGSDIWDECSGGANAKYQGPIVPSGVGGEPVTFANRYELAKLLAMIKAYRSHPSVILWSLNNETGGDSRNPKIFYAIQKAHELDPSRIIVLKSGFGPEGEIMGRPYTTELAYGDYGDNPGRHDSGWHDNHNEDDAGVYQDSLYKNPTDYKCYSTDTNGIAMWGELGTANSPDDDAATVKWYQDHNVPGYNHTAAGARLAAYNAFLDKYQFRAAFPTPEALFRAVGARHYFAASHIIENARISDANDYIALTGWESTTIDNNSGLVDALRHLKDDPALIRQANAPELLVVRPRHYVLAKGDTAIVDTYVVNELNLHGAYVLHFSAAMDAAKNKPFYETSFPVNLTGGEVFGELLKDNITFATPAAGPVTLNAFLTASGGDQPVLTRTEPLHVIDPNPAPLAGTIACVDTDGKLIPALQQQFGITAVPLATAPDKVDTILVSSSSALRSKENPLDFNWEKFLPTVLDRVRAGSRLVLLGVDAQDLGSAAKVLAQQNILTYSGTAGFDDTPWIGHWFFGRKHWLLDGLPSDCVFDWQYQAAGGDGLVMDAPGMEAVVGYGKNPGPGLGLGAAVVPLGQGQIVFLGIPGLNAAFIDGNPKGFQPVAAKRIIYNALDTIEPRHSH